ncbi:hypothetical protein AMECASPLE_019013 [Ameca splendens]|uniref:Uncharacterized protein n=1 Tax=Ameca splendens TaxID=208324 RepID=A0ABV1A9B8_9TELE
MLVHNRPASHSASSWHIRHKKCSQEKVCISPSVQPCKHTSRTEQVNPALALASSLEQELKEYRDVGMCDLELDPYVAREILSKQYISLLKVIEMVFIYEIH